MPWVTDEQVAQVRERERQLGEIFQRQEERLAALEGKPAVDAFTSQWHAGREMVRRKGYSQTDITRLEGFMQAEGIARHDYAARLDPVGPSGNLQLIDGLPEDERGLLLNQDFDGFERLALSRALSGSSE